MRVTLMYSPETGIGSLFLEVYSEPRAPGIGMARWSECSKSPDFKFSKHLLHSELQLLSSFRRE